MDTRSRTKRLRPLEPRNYFPGDCPIDYEQIARHTYCRDLERDEATRAFLRQSRRPVEVHRPAALGWQDGLAIAAAASILVGWGWGLVVVLRWMFGSLL